MQKPRTVVRGFRLIQSGSWRRLEETIIHANEDVGLGCLGMPDAAGDTGAGINERAIPRTKVHVIAIDDCRPVRCEHPFKTATDSPARSGVGGLSGLNTGNRQIFACVTPVGAALKVRQLVRLDCITNAASESIKRLVVEV